MQHVEAEIAVLALGANLGDPLGQIRHAVHELASHLTGIVVSGAFRTSPEGSASQPDFVNAVVAGTWHHSARALLGLAQRLETSAGRIRPFPGAPRTLDVDVVFLGGLRLDEPGLVIPHPRWFERAFVVVPLLQVVPDWVDPVTGRSVAGLARERGWLKCTLEEVADASSMAPPETT